jgi:hypothetical protein
MKSTRKSKEKEVNTSFTDKPESSIEQDYVDGTYRK